MDHFLWPIRSFGFLSVAVPSRIPEIFLIIPKSLVGTRRLGNREKESPGRQITHPRVVTAQSSASLRWKETQNSRFVQLGGTGESHLLRKSVTTFSVSHTVGRQNFSEQTGRVERVSDAVRLR